LHKLVLLAVFMQAANGIHPATAQHDGTRTPRPTVPSWCAVVRSVFSANHWQYMGKYAADEVFYRSTVSISKICTAWLYLSYSSVISGLA